MRRLARSTFALCSAVSLLLFIATCALWVRSYSYAEEIERNPLGPGGRYLRNQAGISSARGYLRYGRSWDVALPSASDDEIAAAREEWIRSCIGSRGHGQWQTDGAIYTLWRQAIRDRSSTFRPESYARGRLNAIGIAFGSETVPKTELYDVPVEEGSEQVYLLHGLLALMTAVLPAAALTRTLTRRRLRRAGRCLQCGYDLRASPDRCPECGTTPAAK